GAAAERDLRAGQPAEFGNGTGSLHTELVERVERDEAVQAAERGHAGKGTTRGLRRESAGADAVVGAHAVDREVVRVRALAVDGELSGFAARGRCHYRARREFQQADQAAAVERQVLDLVACDQGT